MTEPLNLAKMKFVVEDELLQDPQPNVLDVVNAELREKLEAIAAKAERRKGQCMNCELDAEKGKRKCVWCAMDKLPPDDQIRLALERKLAAGPDAPRTVPASEWPPGKRWCGGCRTMVGLTYTRQSRCRGCALTGSRESKWNLSDEQQAALQALSGSKCYVCGRASNVSALAVDHDHTSGEIRGLLCGKGGNSCNEILGLWHDDPRRFLAMSMYLLNPPARKVLDPDKAMSNRQIAEQIIALMKEIFDA